MSNSFNDVKSSDNSNSKERQQKGPKWILLVEDDKALRNNIGEYLASEGGYFVTGVPDARSAILVCRGSIHNKNKVPVFAGFGNPKQALNHPDCLVLDLHLSGSMNGLDLLKILRSDPNIQFLPVVLLSDRGRVDDRLQGYDAGADAYLSKPFDLDELLALIDGLVKRDRFLSRRARRSDEVANIGSAVIKSEELRREILEIKLMLMDLGFRKNMTLNTSQYDDVTGGSIERILLDIKDSIRSDNLQAYPSDVKHEEHSNAGEFVALVSARLDATVRRIILLVTAIQ
jgi:DNA-binding response OmpR family regulator